MREAHGPPDFSPNLRANRRMDAGATSHIPRSGNVPKITPNPKPNPPAAPGNTPPGQTQTQTKKQKNPTQFT